MNYIVVIYILKHSSILLRCYYCNYIQLCEQLKIGSMPVISHTLLLLIEAYCPLSIHSTQPTTLYDLVTQTYHFLLILTRIPQKRLYCE